MRWSSRFPASSSSGSTNFARTSAIHLNLTDDHFERYRDLEDYGAAKARLFENQGAGDFAILNRDDPNVWKLRLAMRSRVIGFGLSAASPRWRCDLAR